ncbi:DUF2156 domain-containing protein [Geomesophilobacter sediminis]|uniref:DUF2156 domain-containing protein n=1 Tax=Geomesophilobacter sediminis TaxID=2798584 RepID=A0A8J7LYI4_9BACT|nr:phosphatidylglycerol lysyltransferase domain-containing protein [Geomesophilobacter sediminis]MBJ6725131.1 DUF2156 domain-containing protein [Geomesophilobacter sediminis]
MPHIPSFPEARGIELSDKPLLDRLFRELEPRISEFSFANLFLFRVVHDYRLTMVGDAVVVLGKGYDGTPYFLPPLSGDIPAALARLWGEGLTLYGADDPFRERYLREVEAVEDRDNSDYLYLREELATLPGSRFHKKKNRVNYFSLRHSFTVEPYRDGHLEGALALLEEWRRVRAAQGDQVGGEVEGAAEALRLNRELGLEGVVVLVEGEVRGFALGERLNAETCVCHFEKADLFMDGIYQLVNREFARLLFTDCTYINREQDLGDLSLRQAKLSYQPVEMVRKYRVKGEG